MDLDSIGMMAWVDARRMLDALPIDLCVLAPAHPSLGCGVLRVLRVREAGGRYDVVAGYESYDRWDTPDYRKKMKP